ncbi:MAG: hypothetical protein ACJ8FS_05015 [Sphingomicrobium sp.]
MKWLDRALSVLLILSGVAHAYGVSTFFRDPQTLFWSLTATLLIFLIAAVNLLRTWRPGDRALAGISAGGSIAYLIATLCFGRIIGDIADFRVVLFGLLTLGLALFSLRDAIRSRPRT